MSKHVLLKVEAHTFVGVDRTLLGRHLDDCMVEKRSIEIYKCDKTEEGKIRWDIRSPAGWAKSLSRQHELGGMAGEGFGSAKFRVRSP